MSIKFKIEGILHSHGILNKETIAREILNLPEFEEAIRRDYEIMTDRQYEKPCRIDSK